MPLGTGQRRFRKPVESRLREQHSDLQAGPRLLHAGTEPGGLPRRVLGPVDVAHETTDLCLDARGHCEMRCVICFLRGIACGVKRRPRGVHEAPRDGERGLLHANGDDGWKEVRCAEHLHTFPHRLLGAGQVAQRIAQLGQMRAAVGSLVVGPF